MSTTQAFLGNSGAFQAIEHAGRSHRVGRLDQRAMGAYSAWLIGRHRERIIAVHVGDPVALRARLKQLEDDALEGRYEFLEELVMGRPVSTPETRVVDGVAVEGLVTRQQGGAINTPAGQVALVAILCGCSQDEALSLMAAKPDEVNHVVGLALAESLTGAKAKDDWAPLPAAEGAEGNGLPR